MNRILVPTDFSPQANYALKAAVLLAKKAGADIVLLHRMSGSEEGVYGEAAHSEAEADLDQLAATFPEVEIHTELCFGERIEGILDTAEKYKADLIAMGSHGLGGKADYFIGSLAQKVVRLARIPVLIVKNEWNFTSGHRIVYASDFMPDAGHAFQLFKKMIRYFSPEIHLVYVQSNPFFREPYAVIQNRMEQFCRQAQPYKCYSHYLRDLSADAGIRRLSEEIGAQLIGISNHAKHPLKRMLTGSTVEALVNHAMIPVLSVNYIDQE